MKSKRTTKHLRETTKVTMQVSTGGGVTYTFYEQLKRAIRRFRHLNWRRVRHHLVDIWKSLMAFLFGLVLGALYGAVALFLQKQPLLFCLYSTVGVACVAAFGMGLSVDFRASVMVMVPSLCSSRGRTILHFVFVSVLLSGPLANTMGNLERGGESLLCGAELAANQTQHLMQKATAPLYSALSKIREITNNAYAAAARIQNLIHAMTDSISHVARTLKNVLFFMANIGDICNEKLSGPYRKCRSLFFKAHADCVELLKEARGLCDIVTAFLPLCELARITLLFCIIPSYIGQHLKKHLAVPVINAFERIKREFRFNIIASMKIDVDVNSSQSLHEMTQAVLAEVSSEVHFLQRLNQPMAYAGLVLLAWAFFRAVRYRYKYAHDLSFDNIYITAQFEKLDRQEVFGASVLPITRRESNLYLKPLAFRLSSTERMAVLQGVASTLKLLLIGGVLVALDFLVFWILDQVHHLATGDIIVQTPVSIAVRVDGSGYASDIFRDLASSFDVLQAGNITVLSTKCLIQPKPPSINDCFILGIILGMSLLMAVTRGFVQRCRRLICAWYYPDREIERIQFLRQQILDQRTMEGKALKMLVTWRRGDTPGGQGCFRRLQALLMRLPGILYLYHLMGLSSVTCLGCGEDFSPVSVVICDVPRCTGLYCMLCFHNLGDMCGVCTQPDEDGDDEDDELDSSDDEDECKTRVSEESLYSEAPTDPRQTEDLKPRSRLWWLPKFPCIP